MPETPEIPALVSLCGRLGRLESIGDATDATANESCWVWRTDRGLLRRSGRPVGVSLLTFACEVAELYHLRSALELSDVPGSALEVMWLELAADNSLLVFLKSVPPTYA